MEEALIELKTKYNELLHGNMDAADGPTTVKIATANDEVLQLKEELKKREVAHSERIVEMVWITAIPSHTKLKNEKKIETRSNPCAVNVWCIFDFMIVGMPNATKI